MLDIVKLHLRAGKGGDGRVSFHRAKFITKGGPNGGDGGNGGSILLIGDKNISTLQSFAGKTGFRAEDGEMGGKNRMSGKKGVDFVLKVPLGTIIWDIGSSESLQKVVANEDADVTEEEGELSFLRQQDLKHIDVRTLHKEKVAEILEDGEEVVICKGGKGGRGNDRFKSSTNQTPMEAEKGTLGGEFEALFELQLLAEVGLVGFPNAGKSTFLSLVTKANPRIANYPFTTLEPNLGVLALPDGREVVIADIPGLIEGASEGKGLGFQFLRHVERCRVLLFVLYLEESQVADESLSDQGKAELLWEQYQRLLKEITDYDPDLKNLPYLLSVNKVDLYPKSLQADIQAFFSQKNEEVILWSGLSGEHVEELKKELGRVV